MAQALGLLPPTRELNDRCAPLCPIPSCPGTTPISQSSEGQGRNTSLYCPSASNSASGTHTHTRNNKIRNVSKTLLEI